MQLDLIRYICQKYQIQPDIKWVGRNLHNEPQKLRKKLQELINRHQDREEIILTYGLCGRSVEGLMSENTRLILPRFDDCICQLIQTDSEKKLIPKKGSIYLTREWTIDHMGILQQCEEIYEKYGDDAQEIIDTIYKDYKEIIILDTGAYETDTIKAYVKKFSAYTGMTVKLEKGSSEVMRKLLLGQYDHTIMQLTPGEAVKANLFY